MKDLSIGLVQTTEHRYAPQYNLKFLVLDKMVHYDLAKPPGLRNTGGGMGTKYARLVEASNYHICQRASALTRLSRATLCLLIGCGLLTMGR